MKKLICFILAIVMTALPLVSCDRGPSAGGGTGSGDAASGDVTDKNGGGLIHGSASGDGEFAVGGGTDGAYVWGDFIFCHGSIQTDHGVMGRVVFRDMTDPDSDWMVLDCAFEEYDIPDGFEAYVHSIKLVADDKAAAENGGVPVFVIVYTLDIFEKSNVYNSRYETRVAAFDMNTQKLSMLKSGIDGELYGDICIYHGAVYFCTTVRDSEQDKSKASIHMIRADSGEYTVTSADDSAYSRPMYIADGVIYYSDGEKIYSSALDFSGFSYLFDAYRVVYVDSEYMYYLTPDDGSGDNAFPSFSLCRKRIGDMSSPTETLISCEELTGGASGFYYCFGSDLYLETETDNGGSVIYRYDIKTGEYGKLIEHEGSLSVRYSTRDYVLMSVRKGPYICFDRKTGEFTTFERWQNPW